MLCKIHLCVIIPRPEDHSNVPVIGVLVTITSNHHLHLHHHRVHHPHHQEHPHQKGHLQRLGKVSRQSAGSELAGQREATNTFNMDVLRPD